MAKKSEAQKAIEMVKKHTGQVPETSTRGWRDDYWVVVGDTLLSWHVRHEDGEIESVHTRGVNDEPDSQTDYFPGRYHDTIQAGIKSVTTHRRGTSQAVREELEPVLGWGCDFGAALQWKSGGGFVREAYFSVTRWVKTPESQWGCNSGFRTEAFVLHDEDAIRMATAYLDGEIPAGVLLDWLQDRDMQGMPASKGYGRTRKTDPIVVGRLAALMDRPQGERIERRQAQAV